MTDPSRPETPDLTVVAVNGSPSHPSRSRRLAERAVELLGGGRIIDLADLLFVPESFRLEEKEDIRARRRTALARVYRSRDEMIRHIMSVYEGAPLPSEVK